MWNHAEFREFALCSPRRCAEARGTMRGTARRGRQTTRVPTLGRASSMHHQASLWVGVHSSIYWLAQDTNAGAMFAFHPALIAPTGKPGSVRQ